MAFPRGPLPRAHHFVPQCWLSGFTKTGQKNGRLWVTDLKRRKQWPSSPANAGHRRDFYRVSAPDLDPVRFEKTFSDIETAIAPVLKSLDEERRDPTAEELEELLGFVAIQWARVPAFRPTILAVADAFHRSRLAEAVGSPDSWAAALKDAGIPADRPGADYDSVREFVRSGEYSLSAEAEWYLLRAFKAVESIIPCLRARHWGTSFSPSGSFIGSDNPVGLDGPKGQQVGFESAEVVVFPVSRHALLCGTTIPVMRTVVNRERIAARNTFTMLGAEEQVYSHIPDFCWLDRAGGYQTDWRLFSKEQFL